MKLEGILNIQTVIIVSYLFFIIVMIVRLILFVVFMKVYNIPFEEAVDSSIQMTSFSKSK